MRRTPWLSPGEFPFLSCEISKINPQGLYLDVLYVGVVAPEATEATEATEAFGMAVVLVQQQQLLLLLLLLVLVLLLLLP